MPWSPIHIISDDPFSMPLEQVKTNWTRFPWANNHQNNVLRAWPNYSLPVILHASGFSVDATNHLSIYSPKRKDMTPACSKFGPSDI